MSSPRPQPPGPGTQCPGDTGVNTAIRMHMMALTTAACLDTCDPRARQDTELGAGGDGGLAQWPLQDSIWFPQLQWPWVMGALKGTQSFFHSTFGHCEPAKWAPKLQWRPHRAMSGWCGDGHRSQSQLALLESIFELSMIAAPQLQCLARLPPRHLTARQGWDREHHPPCRASPGCV